MQRGFPNPATPPRKDYPMIFGAHTVLYSKTPKPIAFSSKTSSAFPPSMPATAGSSSPSHHPKPPFIPPKRTIATKLYLMCDDLPSEIATLAAKGVQCSLPQEARWGSLTKVPLPAAATSPLPTPPSHRHRAPINPSWRTSPKRVG